MAPSPSRVAISVAPATPLRKIASPERSGANSERSRRLMPQIVAVTPTRVAPLLTRRPAPPPPLADTSSQAVSEVCPALRATPEARDWARPKANPYRGRSARS